MTLTIEGFRNPKYKSGFAHVTVDSRPRNLPYSARAGTKPHYPGEQTNQWVGPRRATAEEAAQDYCDYKNNLIVKVRNRHSAQGWFDVLKEDGNEWIDTPPSASKALPPTAPVNRRSRERDFMLTERFEKAVRRLPQDCVAEAKASSGLSALQYATGQVLVKRALRGLTDRPAYVIVPSEPHPDHRKAVESLGVKVIVP